MAQDRFKPRHPHGPPLPIEPFPLGLWVIWTFSVVATAFWVAWPALCEAAPLDMIRLVVTSALVGAVGLLILTALEISIAPWRFLD
jgi:hypothetical protein